MRLLHFRIAYALLLPLLLSACATTTLVDKWSNPEIKVVKHQKLLLVYFSKKASNSSLYEEVMASALNRKGIKTVSGHTLFAEEKSVARESLENGIEKSGADAVLTMQSIHVERKTTVEPGVEEIYPDYWFPEAFARWDMYGYFGGFSYYEPPYVSTYEVGKIQVNFFDAKSGKLLWAATLQTSEPGNAVSVSKEVAHIVVDSLVKGGFI